MSTLTPAKLLHTSPRIYYRRLPLYKYQLAEDYHVRIPELSGAPGFIHKFFHFNPRTHVLSIAAFYSFDGASGPTIDTSDSMRASLCHDALYQAMREDLLPLSYRKAADQVLWRLLREDGMIWWRACYWYRSVRRFAVAFGALNKHDDRVHVAP